MTWLGLSAAGNVLGFLASFAIALAMYTLAYRVLTSVPLGWRDVLPGAAMAAAVLVALQALGAFIVDRWISKASALYGYFGVTLGMLLWISLLAQVTLFGAQLDAVRVRRLWPRSILDRSDPPLDRRPAIREPDHRPDAPVRRLALPHRFVHDAGRRTAIR